MVVQTRSQVDCDPDLDLSELHVEMDVVDTRQDIRSFPVVIPEMLAAMPLTLPVDEEMDSQVEASGAWCGPDELGYG